MPSIGEKRYFKDEDKVYIQYYVKSGWVSEETYGAYVKDFNSADQTILDLIRAWVENEKRYNRKETEIKENLKNTEDWKKDIVNVRNFGSLLYSAAGSLDNSAGTTKSGLGIIANECSADINSAKSNANSAISAIASLKGKIAVDGAAVWTANVKLTKKVNDNIDKQKQIVRDMKEIIKQMKKAKLEITECKNKHKKSAEELGKSYKTYNGIIPTIPAEYEKYDYITEGSNENLPY